MKWRQKYHVTSAVHNRVGQSREIWKAPRHRTGRLPSYPTAALAASARRVNFPNTHSGASAVPKHGSRSGAKQRRAERAKYIWYFATHNQSCYQQWIDIIVNMKSKFELQHYKFAYMKIKSHWRSSPTVNTDARMTLQNLRFIKQARLYKLVRQRISWSS